MNQLNSSISNLEKQLPWVENPLLLKLAMLRSKPKKTKAVEIANFILFLAVQGNLEITNIKLQRMVYYAAALWFLEHNNDELLNESIEAWENGPVIPSVYHSFKYYGNNPIPFIKINTNKKLSGEERMFVHQVYNQFKDLDIWKLSIMTHEEGSPWERISNSYGGKIPRGKDINMKEIASFFRKMIK